MRTVNEKISQSIIGTPVDHKRSSFFPQNCLRATRTLSEQVELCKVMVKRRREGRGQFFLAQASALAASPLSSLAYSRSTVTQKRNKRLPVVFQAGSWKKNWKEACWYVMKTLGTYHLTENLWNSGWKVNGKVTFQEFQPKIEEYVLR